MGSFCSALVFNGISDFSPFFFPQNQACSSRCFKPSTLLSPLQHGKQLSASQSLQGDPAGDRDGLCKRAIRCPYGQRILELGVMCSAEGINIMGWLPDTVCPTCAPPVIKDFLEVMHLMTWELLDKVISSRAGCLKAAWGNLVPQPQLPRLEASGKRAPAGSRFFEQFLDFHNFHPNGLKLNLNLSIGDGRAPHPAKPHRYLAGAVMVPSTGHAGADSLLTPEQEQSGAISLKPSAPGWRVKTGPGNARRLSW